MKTDAEKIAYLKSLLDEVIPALAFYADQTHWVAKEGGGGLRVEGGDCEDGGPWQFAGQRARTALKQVKKIREDYEARI